MVGGGGHKNKINKKWKEITKETCQRCLNVSKPRQAELHLHFFFYSIEMVHIEHTQTHVHILETHIAFL